VKEQDIQRQILDWLELNHIFHWRSNTGAFAGEYKGKKRFVRFGKKGTPDIFAVYDGEIFGIEVKGPNGELSEEQKEWRNEFWHAGGYYVVARCLEDVTCEIFGARAARRRT
jgi:hypothetical protein